MTGEGWFPASAANLPRHLALSAGPLGRCDKCGRSTWEPSAVGNVCKMLQPDGGRCAGTLRPVDAS
jgi:hypothetical protein